MKSRKPRFTRFWLSAINFVNCQFCCSVLRNSFKTRVETINSTQWKPILKKKMNARMNEWMKSIQRVQTDAKNNVLLTVNKLLISIAKFVGIAMLTSIEQKLRHITSRWKEKNNCWTRVQNPNSGESTMPVLGLKVSRNFQKIYSQLIAQSVHRPANKSII